MAQPSSLVLYFSQDVKVNTGKKKKILSRNRLCGKTCSLTSNYESLHACPGCLMDCACDCVKQGLSNCGE